MAPIMPNVGSQGEAMAGAQAITFTATERELIKERTGEEIDKARSFKEIFFKRDTTHKVENEETTVKHEQDLRSLESRRREHESMLKHAAVVAHKERVEIGGAPEAPMIPDGVTVKPAPQPVKENLEKVELQSQGKVTKETAAIMKELNFNPADLYDKFALEQEELYHLLYQVKELHLKRLLATDEAEFSAVSEEIKKETLAAALPAARDWLAGRLDGLTRVAAEYKLKLLKSIKSMHIDDSHKENTRWLEKVIRELS